MDHLEEIRSRINIEELVGSYIQLKKAGRNLKGLCPFHGEKTPSFMVSPDKGIAWCFGCHQGGDIFKFLQLIEHVEFPEAVKILAEKTGVKIPEKSPLAANKRLKTIEINRDTTLFFGSALKENPEMMAYFTERGLTEATIRHFQLGYAPDSYDKLKNHLLGKDHDPRDLVESAVVSQRSIADKNLFDRFRNRLIFPIFDHQDNPVAFSGRIIGDGEPKYLNSPETPAYNKSIVLYGLNWAKETIKKVDRAVIMEGYMDVITAHQAGTLNAVATCGTALTPQQLKLIKRYTHRVALSFDRDNAGLEATLRAIELAQEAELEIGIVNITEGKDPDEFIRKAPDSWKQAVESPMDVMDFYFQVALERHDPKTLEGKRAILDFLLPVIKTYRREVEQGVYLNRLSLSLETDVDLLWNDLRNTPTAREPQKKAIANETPRRIFTREHVLLGLIFNQPEVYKIVAEKLMMDLPIDPDTISFYKTLKEVYTRLSGSLDTTIALKELDENGREAIGIMSLYAEESYPDFSQEMIEREVIRLVSAINRGNLERLQKSITFKIRSTKDAGELNILLQKLNELSRLKPTV